MTDLLQIIFHIWNPMNLVESTWNICDCLWNLSKIPNAPKGKLKIEWHKNKNLVNYTGSAVFVLGQFERGLEQLQ